MRGSVVKEEYQQLQVRPQTLPLPPPPLLSPSSDAGPNHVTSDEFIQYGVTLYQAALKGDWETINHIKRQSPSWISAKITKGGETVLHIAAAAKHIHLIKKLVLVMTTESLAITNKVGNTALCFAAVSGLVEIARLMVGRYARLPYIRGSQSMTPLHMAVLLGHRDMVWYLLEVTDDDELTDQDLIGLLTSSIDTDLYDVALHILNKHRHLAVVRDSKKETALHALARKPLKPRGHQLSMWKRFTTPWCITNQQISTEPKMALQLVQNLWDEVIKHKGDLSKLLVYPWRVLFVAAKLGKTEFLTTLIRSYPDLIWKVDENKRTIFHIAIEHRHEEIFNLIFEIGAIKDLIATYKDDRGNNMLHLAGKLAPPYRLNCVSGAALQMQREILWFKAVEKIVRPEYAESENEDNKTPHALFNEEHEQLRIKGEEWMKKTAESCALVATLIVTVVFSAAFQLPGGVNSDNGSPLLVKTTLFVIFAMSNAVSLFTSTTSILMFLSILTSRYAQSDFLESLPLKLMIGLVFLFISIATMIVAFTATFFITFKQGVRWALIPVSLIALIPITLFISQQYPLLVDIYNSTYKSQSLFKSGKPKLFDQISSTSASIYLSLDHSTTKSPSIKASNNDLFSEQIASRRPTLSISPFPMVSFQSFSQRLMASLIVDPIASEQNSTDPDRM